MTDYSGCVRLVPIFNHLSAQEMEEIHRVATPKHLKKDEFLYQAGDRDNNLYIVHKGRLKVYRMSESGKEQVIRFINAGDFLGELAVFNEEDNVQEMFVQAVAETELCTLTQAEMQKLLLAKPMISLHVLGVLSHRLDQSEKQTTQVAITSVESRLVQYLLDLVPKNSSADTVTVELPMMRQDLASYIGTTPETLSRRFKQLEDNHFITSLSSSTIKIDSVQQLSKF